MTKVMKIPTSKITQFESKQTPTIQQEKNIIKKDNIGTVVPGDALRNINLSTVPSVVQDAINAMGLSVETNILANALIMQIQRDIDNLGDAIVEKSYIDGQVSYLTSLLGQKSDTGDVAAIVDSRLAIVTNNLATTSQVNSLNTRVDESESSIVTLNQTINTKDAARATQIEEVEARVDQSLSNYTAVLNLTVDENGSVISQKIESLVAQNENLSISIDETNQLIIDKDNEWNAKSIKLITSPTGAITGYSFQNGSGLKSTFEINADNFKIANSYNTYTPFSISGTSLYFNGKVAFTNITGTSDLVSTSNIQNAIDNDVTNIDAGKITTGYIGVGRLQAFTVTADRLAPSSGTSTVWKSGGLISNNFNGNAVGSIGSPTQGFRLSANAAGTSSDPNIYGAYIKGATLEGATLIGTSLTINDVKVRTDIYPNNYGPIFITKNNTRTGSNGYTSVFTIVGQGYSSGYHNTRICSNSTPINLIASSYGVVMETAAWTLSVSIEVSYDNVNWTSIASSAISYTSGVSASILYTPTANFNTLYIRSYHAHSQGGSRMTSGILQISLVNGQ